MNYQLCFVVCINIIITYCFFATDLSAGERILARKRRYITFPEGSTFHVTLSLTKGLMWDVPTYNRPPWNSILEFDLIFSLPNTTKKLPFYKHSYLNALQPTHEEIKKRERRDVYEKIEALFDAQGEDGRICILRMLCDAKELLKPGKSLIEDLMYIIFTLPSGYEEQDVGTEGHLLATGQEACQSWKTGCSHSLLQLMLS
ncbi:uncharacterized protein [Periplaneta americana]|uniref:uncharacterized protein n=1 Tax=Periplaneta americana TaxID=6978 RepID=UPI0037E8F44B